MQKRKRKLKLLKKYFKNSKEHSKENKQKNIKKNQSEKIKNNPNLEHLKGFENFILDQNLFIKSKTIKENNLQGKLFLIHMDFHHEEKKRNALDFRSIL